jgi:hypothetical protein
MPTASDFEPSDPHTVGPMPGCRWADDDGAGAVAEQERDERSVGSTTSLSFSAPMTRA